MYDRGLSVLEQYGLESEHAYRGRGALICHTKEGTVLIKEFRGTSKKLEAQAELLMCIEQDGKVSADTLLKNNDGEYISRDAEDVPYVVRHWYEGRECDTKSLEDIERSLSALASLHKCMEMPVCEHYVRESLIREYERKNRELKKIRKFIYAKRRKNDFELGYLRSIQCFLAHAEETYQRLCDSAYEKLRSQAIERGCICHGEFNQHNIILMPERTAAVNFEKWNYDVQTADLYQFMRKILEKNDWDVELGKRMLHAYDRIKPLTCEELENLNIRFSYPEKYWKLANYYYSHNKAWISEKNTEKLEKLMEQHEKWQNFIRKMSI